MSYNARIDSRIIFLTLFASVMNTACILFACVVIAQAVPNESYAEEFPLLLVDSAPKTATFTGIDKDNAFQFLVAKKQQNLSANKLVRWGHPVPSNRPRVILTDGSQLVLANAWSVATIAKLQKDTILVATRSFGEITIPRQYIQEIIFQANAKAHSQLESTSKLERETRRDIVWLKSGDRFEGEMLSLDKSGVEIQLGPEQTKYQLKTIDTLRFSTTALIYPQKKRPRTLVGLRDGSTLVVKSLVQNAETKVISCKLLSGVELAFPRTADVVFLQPLGRSVQYLSESKPQRYQHLPFLEIPWAYQSNRNVLKEPLQVKGKRYSIGLGVHSAARMIYKLQGAHKRFVCEIAVDDSAKGKGSVIFRVLLAQDGKWNEAYTSPIVRGGDSPLSVTVALKNARGIALVVDYADYGDTNDHADWLDARLE